MATVRVRNGVACTVRPQGAPTGVVLVPDLAFDENDPVVKEFAWAFLLDGDVEDASAIPGQKRNVRRQH
jgi:hypothetical protein